ncbi:prenyltransferase/squalene oxidase repeat-containing protein [Goodfellowiella coeruleoviolacea]|uniref:Prenyltransferase and squalene oxidase repeat-containing protein n=1 Tax=Goodfellowiella coeruleoviolacea TaxID=334858 RepID=A0AAE3KMB5_9PSEU|nr:prenyltransferase/squalene oxidase repeat-containing protein [Goodfellowiella coeruleoviolacea]MCP2167393.1 Prenyltransferase and squalene oxidase repeat-containing protein [Goodfellowiella coeruleoviolacea]
MRNPAEPDVPALVDDLVADALADPTGGLYPSVYETGRLVSLVPWLTGHESRIRFLIDDQNSDGSWSGPGSYALAPTLSAVEALLAVLDRGRDPAAAHQGLLDSANRGLAAASRLLAGVDGTAPPGTLVAFLVVPALVGDINERLARIDHERLDRRRLALPSNVSAEPLVRLRAEGWRNPVSTHYLELVGPVATRSADVHPVSGIVGCSAAATAAWLGPDRPGPAHTESVRFLDQTQARLGGPVPGLTSMAWFERAWVYDALAAAGVPAARIAGLLAELPANASTEGAPAAPGFAHDSETSALVLLARAWATNTVEQPRCLWDYDAGTHFLTTKPVGAPSPISNSRILQVFGRYLGQAPADSSRCADAITRLGRWLRDGQTDGHWVDRWHVSPLYATLCCTVALHQHGGAEHGAAVRAAVDWVLASQRANGSWGVWDGTAEETAYALQTLLLTRPDQAGVAHAVRRGREFLLQHGLTGPHPPLWIGKDLYAPVTLIRGAVLSALALSRHRALAPAAATD